MSSNVEQIEEVMKEALERFGAEPEQINRGAKFETLEIDSLDLAELAMVLEDKFGVRITSYDVAGVKTVGDAVDLVASRE
jgi:acyl carrier protein